MAGFVLDVSACMPWCCEDEATAVSEQLLQRAARREPLHVPSLWPWEIMNAVASVCDASGSHPNVHNDSLSNSPPSIFKLRQLLPSLNLQSILLWHLDTS